MDRMFLDILLWSLSSQTVCDASRFSFEYGCLCFPHLTQHKKLRAIRTPRKPADYFRPLQTHCHSLELQTAVMCNR